jgi:hypothetical protein
MEILLTDRYQIPVKSCMAGHPGDGGHDEFRATGAGKDASRGRHASLVRLMVLWTILLGRLFQTVDAPAEAPYARPPVGSVHGHSGLGSLARGRF